MIVERIADANRHWNELKRNCWLLNSTDRVKIEILYPAAIAAAPPTTATSEVKQQNNFKTNTYSELKKHNTKQIKGIVAHWIRSVQQPQRTSA